MIRWSNIVLRDKSRQKASKAESQSSANLTTRVREPRWVYPILEEGLNPIWKESKLGY